MKHGPPTKPDERNTLNSKNPTVSQWKRNIALY